MLNECGFSNAKIAMELGGSVTTSEIRNFSLQYQETNLIKNKVGKSQKVATCLWQKNKKDIFSKIEECHQRPSEVYWMILVFLSVHEQTGEDYYTLN